MAQVINTNMASIFATAALTKSQAGLQTAMQRLSSGVRINKASDDPTGLALATTYDAQRRGVNTAITVGNTAINTIDTNSGYLQQITENVQTLRTLALQNGGSLSASNAQVTQLLGETSRLMSMVGSDTQFQNGVLIDGNATMYTMVGTKLSLSLSNTSNLTDIDTALSTTSSAVVKYGADSLVLQSANSVLQTTYVNLNSSYSSVMDTDYATEAVNLSRNSILQQAGSAMLAQANQLPNNVLTLLR